MSSISAESVAREEIAALCVKLLKHIAHDNDVHAWSSAEDTAIEIIRLTQTVQDSILRRGLQPPLPLFTEGSVEGECNA